MNNLSIEEEKKKSNKIVSSSDFDSMLDDKSKTKTTKYVAINSTSLKRKAEAQLKGEEDLPKRRKKLSTRHVSAPINVEAIRQEKKDEKYKMEMESKMDIFEDKDETIKNSTNITPGNNPPESMKMEEKNNKKEEIIKISLKTGKPLKNVHWAPDNSIVSITRYKREGVTVIHDSRSLTDLIKEERNAYHIVKGSEEEVWKQKRNEIEPSLQWFTPKKIRRIDIKWGKNSKEIITQDQRTKENYQAIFLNDSQIPISPKEAYEKQEEDDTECLQIPIDKPTPEVDNILNSLKYLDVNLLTALLSGNLNNLQTPDVKNMGMNGLPNNQIGTNVGNPVDIIRGSTPYAPPNNNSNLNLSYISNPNPNILINKQEPEQPNFNKHKGSRIVCRYWNTPGGCTKKEKCHYLHINPGDPIPNFSNENFVPSGRSKRGGPKRK